LCHGEAATYAAFTALKEVIMTKTLVQPTSRLICFGGARALTNAPGGSKQLEIEPPDRYQV
jgi:hypothetical protein